MPFHAKERNSQPAPEKRTGPDDPMRVVLFHVDILRRAEFRIKHEDHKQQSTSAADDHPTEKRDRLNHRRLTQCFRYNHLLRPDQRASRESAFC